MCLSADEAANVAVAADRVVPHTHMPMHTSGDQPAQHQTPGPGHHQAVCQQDTPPGQRGGGLANGAGGGWEGGRDEVRKGAREGEREGEARREGRTATSHSTLHCWACMHVCATPPRRHAWPHALLAVRSRRCLAAGMAPGMPAAASTFPLLPCRLLLVLLSAERHWC